MHRQNVLAIALLVFASSLVVTVGYAKGWGPLDVINAGVTRIIGSAGATESVAPHETRAPEFSPGTWINSDAKTLQSLRGRVVLIQFWTFGCYNCRNTLPTIKKWDTRYRDRGLTIIGVHTPETDSERNIEDVRREAAALGIMYPVVTDNDYATWKLYRVEAWPTLFLLDKQGRVRWTHVGEGAYDETEQVIKNLLAEN